MLRIVGGLVAGAIVAICVVMLVEMLGHTLYPVPADIDTNDRAAMAEAIRSVPLVAKLFVVAAWFAGALSGSLVANRIARLTWPAWVIALLIVAGGIVNILMIPHPAWMQIAAVVVPVLGGLAAVHLARRAATGIAQP